MPTEDVKDWWRSQLTISLGLQIAIMTGGWLITFGMLRTTITDHERRIVSLEAEIVPRREHEATAHIQEQKEQLIDHRLENIEQMLNQMMIVNRK